jgi:beta-glucosidase
MRKEMMKRQEIEGKIEELLSKMSLQEKIGQMCQMTGASEDHLELARQGLVGSFLNTADVETTPLYPFGYGLSYTEFKYDNLQLSAETIRLGESLEVSADIENIGKVAATEVVQLYVRDLVGSITRPVKELKGFQRVRLEPGEKRTVEFKLGNDDLAFHNQDMDFVVEPRKFHVWIGTSSTDGLQGEFEVV